jgi:phage-related protein
MNDAEVKLQVKIDSSNATTSINDTKDSAKSLSDNLEQTEMKGEKAGDSLSKKMGSVSKAFEDAGKKLTLSLTAPLTALSGVSIKNASDLNETLNKVDVAFGSSSDYVKEWGNTTIKQFGIAKGTALDMAALYGDMATGMGMNTSEASKLSTNLTGLAGDLASFKNISVDIAKTALAGVFTGETESLKQLGIIMTQTNLEQFAQSKGIKKSMDDMSQAELIQLRYAYVTEMSKNAVGDFARTSDSTANQSRILSETFKELTADLGQKLLPAFNGILSKGLKILDWISGLNDSQKDTLINIAKILAIIGPLLVGIGKGIEIFKKLNDTAKMFKMTTMAFTGTAGLIIAGIVLIGIAIYEMIKHWDEIKSAVSTAISTIATFFTGLWTNVTTTTSNIFSAVTNFFTGVISAIATFFTNAWTAFIAFVTPIIDFINTAIQTIIGILNIPYQFLVNLFILIVALVAMGLEAIYNVIAPIVMWIYNTILMPIFNFFTTIFTSIFNFVANIFTSIFNFIGGVIESIKNAFLSYVGFMWNDILSPILNIFKSIFDSIWNYISGIISNIIDKVKYGFSVIADFVRTTFSNVRDFIGSIFQAVGNVLKAPINAIIGTMNGVLRSLNKVKVPDWVPGLGGMSVNFPLIPKLKIGTDEVLNEGLAYLHKGESVVPANVVKGGYNTNNITNNNNNPIILNLTTEAKVNEEVLFSTNQRINYNKNLQTGF